MRLINFASRGWEAVTALSFYEWARDEGWASAGPFNYSTGSRIADGAVWTHRRNHAKLRPAKRHAQIKYLEHDFAALFLDALAGLTPDGTPDDAYRGLPRVQGSGGSMHVGRCSGSPSKPAALLRARALALAWV
jgi:hypothetical protein